MGKNFGRPSTKRSLPNVLNKKQLIKLFEAIDDSHIFMGSMIALFCGLRIGEVCSLKKQDIDLESEKVIVRKGKGDKDRVVMLPTCMKPMIEKWFRASKETDYYIHTTYKHKYIEGAFATKFSKAFVKADLRIKTFKTSHGQQRHAYSFHTLRHTYATYLLEQGVDLYYVQRSLGHVDIHTTQVYAYISNKDLQDKINKAFGIKASSRISKNSNIDNPFNLLKLKFANGEISMEEFQHKYSILEKMEKTSTIF